MESWRGTKAALKSAIPKSKAFVQGKLPMDKCVADKLHPRVTFLADGLSKRHAYGAYRRREGSKLFILKPPALTRASIHIFHPITNGPTPRFPQP